MNLGKALGFISFFKHSRQKNESISLSDAEKALSLCLNWYKASLDRKRLPASSYSLLLGTYNGPSVRVTAHWLNFFSISGNRFLKDSEEHAHHLANWLIQLQRPDGTWPVGSADYSDRPAGIFPSALASFAMMNYAKSFERQDAVRDAVRRNLDWLLCMQSDNGEWKHYLFSRPLQMTVTAAVLTYAGRFFENPLYSEAGMKAFRFYLSFQTANGYFHYPGMNPNGHFASDYVYTLFGLALFLNAFDNPSVSNAFFRGFIPLTTFLKRGQCLPGIVDKHFNSPVNYVSPFANSILALAALYVLEKKEETFLKSSAETLLTFLAANQAAMKGQPFAGGFTASLPASGGHKPYEITGESVAIFAEALVRYIMLSETEIKPSFQINLLSFP